MVEIKQKEETRIILYTYCPKCNKEIKGSKDTQVEYNLETHMRSCKNATN